jgi:transposase
MNGVEVAGLMVSPEQRREVEQWLRRRDLAPRLRERLEMVKAVAFGQDLRSMVAWSGRSARTVRRWLERYRAGGVAALVDAPRSGRPPQADAAYRQALEEAVATSPRALGLPFDVWTSPRLSAYLMQTTGVRIAPGWLRALLAQQRYAYGRPKHTLHHLQDWEEVAACQQTLAAVGERRCGRARPVRAAL